MTRLPFAAALLSASLVFAAPALAQEGPAEGEKVNQVIVYGDDACPKGAPDEILVCAKLPESERFRVPEIFRGGSAADPRNEAWANKIVSLQRIGRFGTDSCSPSGLGGFTGCTQALLAGAAAERIASNKTDWQALIADERAKRIAGIDAAAAKVDAAVTAEEAALAERQRKAAELEELGGAPAPVAPPQGDPDAEPLPIPEPR